MIRKCDLEQFSLILQRPRARISLSRRARRMAARYSRDLRERVVAACDEGAETRAEVAERFMVGQSWVRRLLQRRSEADSIDPKPRGVGQPPAFAGEAAERLRAAVEAAPDATLRELAAAAGVACSTSATDRGSGGWGSRANKVDPGRGVGPPRPDRGPGSVA